MSAEIRYATAPITAADAEARFGGLLAPPLEHRRRTGPLADGLVAAVAERNGQRLGVALGQVVPGLNVGEVLCLGVVPGARRQGVGAGLLARLETALAAAGCPAVQGAYRSDWTGVDAVGALMDAAGWGPPVVQRLYYRIEGMAFMGQSVMQNVPVPEGYTVTDWDTLADADRARVEALVAADPAARSVSPFQNLGVVSPDLSVWLRRGGEVVGWHLVVASPRVVEYAGLYVTPENRKSRAGMALIAASGWRHVEAYRDAARTPGSPPVPTASLFAIEPKSREMRAFADAYLRRPGITETTVWLRGKRLA